MQNHIPRLLLSATGSDSGKTTMMLALLSAFQKSGVVVQSYKSGPDYIDPMFHEAVTHRPAYHTDPFFLQSDAMRKLVAATAQQADLALIEGAMGFYDGIGQTSEASAYTVSQWLETPAVLVVNPQKMGRSVAAICKGFLQLEPHNRIVGFLLNRVRSGMAAYYQAIIERETGLPVYGYLPELPEVQLPSRHLGLYTAEEVDTLQEKIDLLGETARKTIALERLQALAETAPPLPLPELPSMPPHSFRLGVAKDAAFCFYYAENLELLQQNGAELVFFSPLTDSALPEQFVIVEQAARDGVFYSADTYYSRVALDVFEHLFEGSTTDDFNLFALEILVGGNVVERSQLSLNCYSLHVSFILSNVTKNGPTQ